MRCAEVTVPSFRARSVRGRISAPIVTAIENQMSEKLLGRIGDFLQSRTPWYKLPRLLAMPRLVEIRNQLRRENLHDTEEPPLEKKAVPANLDPALRNE